MALAFVPILGLLVSRCKVSRMSLSHRASLSMRMSRLDKGDVEN
jgi:hypothetical protein